MNCSACGNALSPNARFCGKCGTPAASGAGPATEASAPSLCQLCSQPLSPGARFCATCGWNVAAAIPASGAGAAEARPAGAKTFEDELDELFAEASPASEKSAAELFPPPAKNVPAVLDLDAQRPAAAVDLSTPSINLSASSLIDTSHDDALFAPTQLHSFEDSEEALRRPAPELRDLGMGAAATASAVPKSRHVRASANTDASSGARSRTKPQPPKASRKGPWLALIVVVLIAAVGGGAWLALQPTKEKVVQQRVQPSSSPSQEDIEKAQAITGPQVPDAPPSLAQPEGSVNPLQAQGDAQASASGPEAGTDGAAPAALSPAEPAAVPVTVAPRPAPAERRKPAANNLDSLLD